MSNLFNFRHWGVKRFEVYGCDPKSKNRETLKKVRLENAHCVPLTSILLFGE